MSTVSVIIVCVIASVLAAILKQYNSIFAVITVCAAAVIIISFAAVEISELLQNIFSAIEDVGETVEFMKILVKAVCISILAEIAGSICKDSGNASLAVCVDISAKIILLALAFPLVEYLITIIQDLFKA